MVIFHFIFFYLEKHKIPKSSPKRYDHFIENSRGINSIIAAFDIKV